MVEGNAFLMFSNTVRTACPQCAYVPSIWSSYNVTVQRAFQTVGVDIMDLPKTERGKQHFIVFNDFRSKWSSCAMLSISDQTSLRLVKLFVEEVVSMFGVPETLLSDRVSNLLLFLMQEICKLLGT